MANCKFLFCKPFFEVSEVTQNSKIVPPSIESNDSFDQKTSAEIHDPMIIHPLSSGSSWYKTATDYNPNYFGAVTRVFEH